MSQWNDPHQHQQYHAPKSRSWALRHKFLTSLIVFGALAGMGGILQATGQDKPQAAPAPTVTITATANAKATAKASAAAAVKASAKNRSRTLPAPRPTLRGFGATLAQWQASHTLDLSVPARNAYLPQVADSDGEDTWQIVTVADGRIISYSLNVVPSPLKSAEERARQELPADARVLWKHTFGDTCAQEQFSSATLAAALGDGQVNVEFDNAVSSAVAPVTEELFSTWDAPTVAQAPHC